MKLKILNFIILSSKINNYGNRIKKEGNLFYFIEDVLFVSVFFFFLLKVKIGDILVLNLVKVNFDVRDVVFFALNKLLGLLFIIVVLVFEFLWVLRDFLGL